jgi:hypothetical protein
MLVMVMFQGTLPEPLSWSGGSGFLILLLTIALFGFAAVLLRKSVGYQVSHSASLDEDEATRAGSAMAWITVLVIILLWLLRWFFVGREAGRGILIALFRDIVARPMDFALLVVVASIPLVALALFNFLTLYRISLRNKTEGNLLAASAAAILITTIQLIGSIASIISLALM